MSGSEVSGWWSQFFQETFSGKNLTAAVAVAAFLLSRTPPLQLQKILINISKFLLIKNLIPKDSFTSVVVILSIYACKYLYSWYIMILLMLMLDTFAFDCLPQLIISTIK